MYCIILVAFYSCIYFSSYTLLTNRAKTLKSKFHQFQAVAKSKKNIFIYFFNLHSYGQTC